MVSKHLPNIWHLYNLRSSPYFQDTLRAQPEALYPIDLFVGREGELERALRVIGSAPSSRQAIAGAPGLGKTTLTQRIKASASEAGYLGHPNALRITSEMTTSQLLIQLLSHVYEVVVGDDAERLDTETARTTRQLVRAFRVRDATANLSILGIGGGGGRVTQFVESGLLSPALVVPELLARLAAEARAELGAQGLLVHINNLENLVEDDIARAAKIVRDIRDLLLLPGFHYLFVGTPEAIAGVIDRHGQVRSIFSVGDELTPLSDDEFALLLERRYEFLKLDEGKPALPPVELTAARDLYGVFRGDLRGTLRALDQAAQELAGYGEPATAPMTAEEIRAVVAPRYRMEMRARLGEAASERLLAIADLPEPFTQTTLRERWGLAKGSTSTLIDKLQRHGYLVQVGREGRTIRYGLTGTARLVLEGH